jgi:hypothetical protein
MPRWKARRSIWNRTKWILGRGGSRWRLKIGCTGGKKVVVSLGELWEWRDARLLFGERNISVLESSIYNAVQTNIVFLLEYSRFRTSTLKSADGNLFTSGEGRGGS